MEIDDKMFPTHEQPNNNGISGYPHQKMKNLPDFFYVIHKSAYFLLSPSKAENQKTPLK